MTRTDCARAETLAGAIALDEATDGERDAYRRHLAACRACVEAYGGEREIARVMGTIAQARDEESWEPDMRAALRDRSRMRRSAWRLGLGVGAVAVAVSAGIHLMAAGIVRPIALVPPATVAAVDSTFHVHLERRPRTGAPAAAAAPVAAPAAPAAPKPLIVTHNVVALAAPPAKSLKTTRSGTTAPVDPAIAGAMQPSPGEARSALSSMQTQSAAPTYSHQAESIAMAPIRVPTIHDVAPVEGHLSFPNPPAIAAREMAAEGLTEATSYFALAVDERGIPTLCSIQKSSGILAIDESVCRAAMHARFTPRTVNGKPTTSIYRDAFVFIAPAGDQ